MNDVGCNTDFTKIRFICLINLKNTPYTTKIIVYFISFIRFSYYIKEIYDENLINADFVKINYFMEVI